MSKSCPCGVGFGNSGQNNCNTLQGVTKKLIYVNTFNNAGVRNYIDPATPLVLAAVTALLNQTDTSKRWYPTPELKNADSERADAIYEAWEDGSKDFVKDGVRTFKGIFPKQTPTLLANLNKGCNTQRSVYIVDAAGNIYGYKRGTDGFVYPIPVSAWYAKYVFPKDTANAQIELSFEFSTDIADEDLVMISADSFTDWAPLQDLRGLLTVTPAVSAITSTSIAVALKTEYGAINAPTLAKGWLITDFAMYNVTTSAPIIITSVTESVVAPGTYVVVFPSPTATNVIRVTPAKVGYEATPVTFVAV